LLHGFSDDASGWTAVGRANVILDNLIAQGKAKPMIVVMPLGYGTMEMIRLGWGAWDHTDVRDINFKNFTETLLTEVMPRVEGEYRIANNRESRAIAGLSMGGSESLLTGLNHLDKFSWIGAFSSGGIPEEFPKDFPSLDAKANQQIHLLWIACGTEDHLIGLNRNFRAWLKDKGVRSLRRYCFAELFRSRTNSSTDYGTFTDSRSSDATRFTAAVLSNLSQANRRPSSARFSVLNNTTENSWR
jgi:enterochelin esterase family protein